MDRISELSDELLVKILLMVPTEVAVSTSALSKRWEFLRMWLPKLKYGVSNYSSDSECERLQGNLNNNLPLHRSPVLESFKLELLLSSWFNPKDIRLWVVIAISHCLQELKVKYSSYQDKPNILPSNLYTSKSLRILKLDGKILMNVPRMVSLPALKILKLLGVRYSNEGSLQRLLSNCPVLEDLSLDLCDNDTTRRLTVVVPSLMSLSLHIYYDHDIDGIMIVTPSLEYLDFVDHNDKNHNCLVEQMPNLIEAYVDVESPNIISLIGSISSVKCLKICSKTMYDEGFVFNQLEHLQVCRCQKHSLNLLARLLKDSSGIQVLDFSNMEYHEPNDLVYWNQPITVPECLLSSLQTLNWPAYTGKPEEEDIVVYILQNAVHLKTARIESSESHVPKLGMIKKLAFSSRASATCNLIFE